MKQMEAHDMVRLRHIISSLCGVATAGGMPYEEAFDLDRRLTGAIGRFGDVESVLRLVRRGIELPILDLLMDEG